MFCTLLVFVVADCLCMYILHLCYELLGFLPLMLFLHSSQFFHCSFAVDSATEKK